MQERLKNVYGAPSDELDDVLPASLFEKQYVGECIQKYRCSPELIQYIHSLEKRIKNLENKTLPLEENNPEEDYGLYTQTYN